MCRTNVNRNRMKKGKLLMVGTLCGLIVVIAAVLLFVAGRKSEHIVGTDISDKDITEFIYTRSSSAYPPYYQGYHFYKEGETYNF